MESRTVEEFLSAYGSSLVDALDLGTVVVQGRLELKSDKVYAGQLYCRLTNGSSQVTVKLPARFRELAGRQVEVRGQPARQLQERQGALEIVLRALDVLPLEAVPEDRVGPLLPLGEQRRLQWSRLEHGIEARILAGEAPRVLLLYGKTSKVDRDVRGALGHLAHCWTLLELRADLTDPRSIAEALSGDLDVDLAAIVRGGGELEALSDPDLLEAVVRTPFPVVSAVGHDVDRPLLEAVVNHRFATPSNLGYWLKERAEAALQARESAGAERMRELKALQDRIAELLKQASQAEEQRAAARRGEDSARRSAKEAESELQILRRRLELSQEELLRLRRDAELDLKRCRTEARQALERCQNQAEAVLEQVRNEAKLALDAPRPEMERERQLVLIQGRELERLKKEQRTRARVLGVLASLLVVLVLLLVLLRLG